MNMNFDQILVLFLLFLEILLGIYLLIPLLCLIGYFIFKIFHLKTPEEKRTIINNKDFSFGLIITAHQEISMIPPLIDSLKKQSYNYFIAYVVVDDVSPGTIKSSDSKIKVLEPTPSLHAKIKSISYAISQFEEAHDAIIIIDADNLLHPAYLENVNRYFQKGYKVVQTNFLPKNTDTLYARMDAIGDMFNFFIERQVRYYFNLSATIWGSGVAIETKLYQAPIYKDNLGGFDRKLQAHLVTKVERIAFAEDAILYDEKISSGKSLETQRTRWINTYFKYFKESTEIFTKGLKDLNFNLIYFGFNVMRPPLFLVFSGFIFTFILLYFMAPEFVAIGIFILISFIISFTGIVLIKGGKKYLKTLAFIPLFIFRQFAALARIGEAKKSFMKTEHTNVVYIEDILQREKERY